jgi:hypothetical protein
MSLKDIVVLLSALALRNSLQLKDADTIFDPESMIFIDKVSQTLLVML